MSMLSKVADPPPPTLPRAGDRGTSTIRCLIDARDEALEITFDSVFFKAAMRLAKIAEACGESFARMSASSRPSSSKTSSMSSRETYAKLEYDEVEDEE